MHSEQTSYFAVPFLVANSGSCNFVILNLIALRENYDTSTVHLNDLVIPSELSVYHG